MQPTTNSTIGKTTTYSVTANNCKGMSVTFSRLGCLTAKTVAEILSYAFRDLQVVCDQTGEVAYNHYKSPDWFARYDTEMEAIQKVVLFIAER